MKFAKQLDEDAIPEWKGNYFGYKVAKKRLKAVRRAIRSVANSSRPRTTPGSSFRDLSGFNLSGRDGKNSLAEVGRRATQPAQVRHNGDTQSEQARLGAGNAAFQTPTALPISELSPLQSKAGQQTGDKPRPYRMVSYGSIIGSPPNSPALRLKRASTLELPGTAVVSDEDSTVENSAIVDLPELPSARTRSFTQRLDPSSIDFADIQAHHAPNSQLAHRGNAYDVRPPVDIISNGATAQFNLHNAAPKRTNSMPNGNPFFRRLFSVAGNLNTSSPRNNDIALEAYEELDFRKAEFFLYLDKELLKIETFYKSKEDEAIARLGLLREHLHVMRTCRLQEITVVRQKHSNHDMGGANNNSSDHTTDNHLRANQKGREKSDAGHSVISRHRLTRPFAKSIDLASDVFDKVRTGHVGKTSEAMGDLGTPSLAGHWEPDPSHRDYSRRPLKEVPYRTAKRKMKLALAEYYRGLELLKSYTLLNREAYRKINKKYDKTVNANRKLRYMEEKINKAHFVTSDIVDQLLGQVEDLYARYFERGNRKVAVSKLRAKLANAGDYSGAIARTCALIGAGAVFAIQATVYGAHDIYHPRDLARHVQTEYLLQLYAGYFLCLLLMGLFCLGTAVFNKYKVNYQFIFEFDNRHHLDWHQLCELPAWLFFIFGLSMWLNFMHIGGDVMYLYWFVILIGLSVLFLFLPAPVIYHRARRWFVDSLGRLLAAGIYPVEFRDFFLGDMFCSLTYSMGNIELFFCLYARNWNGEGMCNSTHSRLLGFLSALPGIWRALQCLRRYWDTRNAFPHLANCGKYMCTILMYMSLSLYRINRVSQLKAFFIACATVNAVYCSFWDLFMDWSLGDFKSKNFGLRPALAYRKIVWIYYLAVILDPILRFNWIFYAIYTGDVQHSTIVSFLVALSEVMRRGLWTLFRVENEHCSNIAHSRASRNVELPYQFSEPTSTDNLLESNKQRRDRPGAGHCSDDAIYDSDEHSIAKADNVLDDAVLSTDHAKATTDVIKSGPLKHHASMGIPGSKGNDRSIGKSASQRSSPQMTRTPKTPTSRSDVATPFRLLNIRFGNASAAEAQMDPSAVDTERATRSRPAVTNPRASDGLLHRTDTNGSGSIVTSLQRIGDTMRSAHKQDYEKRKKPEENLPPEDSDEDDADESEEDE